MAYESNTPPISRFPWPLGIHRKDDVLFSNSSDIVDRNIHLAIPLLAGGLLSRFYFAAVAIRRTCTSEGL